MTRTYKKQPLPLFGLFSLRDTPQIKDAWCDVLDARERHIVASRRMAAFPVPYHVLSAEWDVSKERIKQVEFRAVRKLLEAEGVL